MLVCFECQRAVGEAEDVCRNCGSTARAQLNARGNVVALLGDTGVPCATCGTRDEELLFRRYRRVVGMLLLDRIHESAGYFCSECRRSLFGRHMTLTLVLGWWGLLALLFRNPWAIGVNVKALSAPPRQAGEYGALTLDDLHEQTSLADAIDTGELDDAYECTVCRSAFTTFERALKHADEAHTEMRFDDAKAALRRLGGE